MKVQLKLPIHSHLVEIFFKVILYKILMQYLEQPGTFDNLSKPNFPNTLGICSCFQHTKYPMCRPLMTSLSQSNGV